MRAGVANIIVWKRDFDRLLPVIMGSKFVRVAGKLQTESGVTHIVADTIDDLTSWLTDLLEGAGDTGEMSDRLGGSSAEARTALAPFVRKNRPDDHEMLTREAGNVMPKGRNFQ